MRSLEAPVGNQTHQEERTKRTNVLDLTHGFHCETVSLTAGGYHRSGQDRPPSFQVKAFNEASRHSSKAVGRALQYG
jgi:hypothetical protein